MYSKLNALEYEIDFSQFQFEFSKDGAMEKLMRSKAKRTSKVNFLKRAKG